MKVVELSGGVGGARMARGLSAIPGVDLTVVVNIADDADNHGLRVSPDLDTVLYTLAGVEGPYGWGRAKDTFRFNEELARFDVDTTFQLGDLDLALKVYRTHAMNDGASLSEVMATACTAFGVSSTILPSSNDLVRTEVLIDEGWITFQDYFVSRRHRDTVRRLRYIGANQAEPAPGVVDAIEAAEHIVIAPSNPPLSIWPILALEGIRESVVRHPRVTAVSPLIGGKAVKGPAAEVMTSLGLAPGNVGVAEAYRGTANRLVIDSTDVDDVTQLGELDVMVTDTKIAEIESARRLAMEILGIDS